MRRDGPRFYQGEYTPKNKQKYVGTLPIIYRSNWELQFCKWLDMNKAVTQWASESTVIPYIKPSDRSMHRYYIDFTVKFHDGKIFLFEVKPDKQTKPPVQKKRKTKRYLKESLTYTTNVAKWKAAQAYAEKYGMHFQILTEKQLKKLGLHIM